MVMITATLALSMCVGGIQTEGHISQYAPNIMRSVIEVRQEWLGTRGLPNFPTDMFDCYVAVPYGVPTEDYPGIGSVIYLLPPGQNEWARCLAVDCGGIADGGRDWMLRNNILVEVDYRTARRWHTVGRLLRDAQMLYCRETIYGVLGRGYSVPIDHGEVER